MTAGYFSRPEDRFDNSYTPLWYKLCCFLFMGMLCFLVMLLSTSFAYDYPGFDEIQDSGSMEYNSASLFCYFFEFLFDSLSAMGTTMGNALQGKFGIAEIPTDAFDKVFTNTVSVMKTIGFSLCLFFFIMTLIDLMTSERLSFEIFWKHFLKLVLGVFMVDNAENVKKFVIDFGNKFSQDIINSIDNANNFTNPFTQYGDFMKAAVEFAVETPLGWLLLLALGFLVGIFPLLFGIIFKGAVILIAFSRLLELYLRCAFLPVALALMTDDGWRGAGGRYIKKIIAVSVQGVALIIIASLVGAACNGTFDSFLNISNKLTIVSLLQTSFNTIIITLGLGLAGLSLMFKSMGIINDVFGV